jgi:transcriptional regulator with XRE-family HTH domain
MLTGAQIRMARGHLRWSVKDLAEMSTVSSATIKRMEEVDDTPNAMADNLQKIQKALEDAGVVFIPQNGGGAGVRLKKREGAAALHPKPTGPATDVVDRMDAAIEADRSDQRPKKILPE